MRRRFTGLIPLLLFPFIVLGLSAQCIVDGWERAALAKCDARLRMLLASGAGRTSDAAHENGSRRSELAVGSRLSLFISGDPLRIERLVRAAGGRTGGVVGSLVTAVVPVEQLPAIAADRSVSRLELSVPVELHNDSVRADIRADQVHRGTPPLNDGYSGKGVILGFIDTGIDYRHPEFRDLHDSLRTRIIALWTQHGFGVPPPSFGYGSEWSAEQIQAAVEGRPDPDFDERDLIGHGTHVAATAAGLHGIAPDADIIMVQLRDVGGTWDDFTASVLDAAIYIYEKAESLGRPCVINASLGSYLHPQDGSDPLARTLDTLVGGHPGRFFVASAGNSGGHDYHWRGDSQKDSVWIYTWNGSATFRVPDSSLPRFSLSIQFDQLGSSGSATNLGGTLFRDGEQLRRSVVVIDTLDFASPIGVRIARVTSSSGGNGQTDIVVSCANLRGEMVRLAVRGSSPFHCWSEGFLSPSAAGHLLDETYGIADENFTTGTPAIAHNVISVGSYVNRSQYLTADGELYPADPVPAGDLSDFSSHGPAADGRIKPDIMAPGSNVISARSRDIDIGNDKRRVADPSMLVSSGTSMAAPSVTGAVALYLQAHPAATIEEVRSALTGTARHDLFTDLYGRAPNGVWGYGKLDIFAAMTSGMAAQASGAVQLFQSVPNPSSGGSVTVRFRIIRDESVEIAVYNVLGERMGMIVNGRMEAGIHEAQIDQSGWPAGAYRIIAVTPSGRADGMLLLLR